MPSRIRSQLQIYADILPCFILTLTEIHYEKLKNSHLLSYLVAYIKIHTILLLWQSTFSVSVIRIKTAN